MKNATESSSSYNNLEKMSVQELLTNINREDQKVALAVQEKIEAIEKLVSAIVPRMQAGGRLFYIGAGTSGRLGILDASECPPTYGVPPDWVIGIIAGGDKAIRHAVEFAEDNREQAWKDLEIFHISAKDSLIGIAASGKTPYVLGGLQKARQKGILTSCIVCNTESPIASIAEYPIEIAVGSEFVTGSTRMKSGTAQKMVLNMISTSIMIRLGRVRGNKMVDMQLSNNKLIDRGTRMIMQEITVDYDHAQELLKVHGSVRGAVNWHEKKQN